MDIAQRNGHMRGIGEHYVRIAGLVQGLAALARLTLQVAQFDRQALEAELKKKGEVKEEDFKKWLEGKTDAEGRVRLPMPWRGQYVLQAVHMERTAGTYDGKPYEARRHRTTLTVVSPRGQR